MKQGQEAKPFVCKVCNRRFMSSRVLSGHMKSHLASNPKMEDSNMAAQSGNDLRECPKKTLNVSSFHVCKVCGKEFELPRSLFGHLRHHSAKTKAVPCRKCGKSFRTMKSLLNHTRVHQIRVSEVPRVCSSLGFVMKSLHVVETLNLVRRKRSKRIRYRASASSSFSSFNDSSPLSEIDPEVQQVAMSLIMLSMGVHDLGGNNFQSDDSSDNNSTDFEVESPNQDKKRLRSEVEFSVGGNEKFLKLKTPRNALGSVVLDSLNNSTEQKQDGNTEFDSGFSDIGKRKIESFHGDDLLLYGTKSKLKSDELLTDASDTELVHSISYSELQDDSRKKSEYKCRTCDKVFSSHRALGGHQTGHRRSRSSVEPKHKNEENSQHDCEINKLEVAENIMEQGMHGSNATGYDPWNIMTKEHKCSICLKSFATGQALGGHKKVHQSKGLKNLSNVLDLNLPARIDEEVASDTQSDID